MELKQMPNKYQGLEKAEVAAWLENPVTKRAMEIVDAALAEHRMGTEQMMENTLSDGDDAALGRAMRYMGVSSAAWSSAKERLFQAAVDHVR